MSNSVHTKNIFIQNIILNDKTINNISTSTDSSSTTYDNNSLTTKGYVDKNMILNNVGKKTNNRGAEIFNDYTNNYAYSINTHAEGDSCVAGVENSNIVGCHAEGTYTKATGYSSHSEGYDTQATGYYCHSEGSGDHQNNLGIASGDSAHSEGCFTLALGDYSHSGGFQTVADKESMTAIGKYNIYDSTQPNLNDNKLFVVGNGNRNLRSDAFVVKDTGDVFAQNNLNCNNIIYNDSNYKNVKVFEIYNFMLFNADIEDSSKFINNEFYYSIDNNEINVCEVLMTFKKNYVYKAIINNDNITFEEIELKLNTIIKCSFNNTYFFYHNINQNILAHNETYNSSDIDFPENSIISHSEGVSCASELYSHAEGLITYASGNASHAEGFLTSASGNASHASGIGTIADQENQFVCGCYNTKNNTNSLFVVGNGNSDSSRSDAFVVKKSGDIYIKNKNIFDLIYPIGSIYISKNSTNPATLFGVGTWSLIKGKFIYGADPDDLSNFPVDDTGGGSKQISTSNIPELTTSSNGSSSASWSSRATQGTWDKQISSSGNFSLSISQGRAYNSASGGLDGGAQKFDLSLSNHSHTVGNSSPTDYMQPYIVRYIWERTA